MKSVQEYHFMTIISTNVCYNEVLIIKGG